MEVVPVAATFAIVHQNHDVVGGRPAPGPQRAAALLTIPAPLLCESPRDGPAFVRQLKPRSRPRTAPVVAVSLI